MSFDTVFIDGLQLSTSVGTDCWARTRPQPVVISVYLHLSASYLDRAGVSDNVLHTINYGHLAKGVIAVVSDAHFTSARPLVSAVALTAFKLAGEAAVEVRVRVELPKMILLASNFAVEAIAPAGGNLEDVCMTVFVTDLTLAVIIGVNPPERKVKQRVITNITFHELQGHGLTVDYPSIVAQISENIEASSYLTLEKFVLEVVRAMCLSSEAIRAVTVRAQKPSAVTFARSSGVEITRERSAFVS